MNCPQCGSDKTRKYSIVYEEGTSHGKSEGFSDHASYETAHFSQTPLAKRCAPPKEPEIGSFPSIVGFIFSSWFGYKIGSLVGGFWWGLGAFLLSLIALAFLWHLIVGNKKMNQYRIKHRVWEKSWLCTKCGNGFLSE